MSVILNELVTDLSRKIRILHRNDVNLTINDRNLDVLQCIPEVTHIFLTLCPLSPTFFTLQHSDGNQSSFQLSFWQTSCKTEARSINLGHITMVAGFTMQPSTLSYFTESVRNVHFLQEEVSLTNGFFIQADSTHFANKYYGSVVVSRVSPLFQKAYSTRKENSLKSREMRIAACREMSQASSDTSQITGVIVIKDVLKLPGKLDHGGGVA